MAAVLRNWVGKAISLDILTAFTGIGRERARPRAANACPHYARLSASPRGGRISDRRAAGRSSARLHQFLVLTAWHSSPGSSDRRRNWLRRRRGQPPMQDCEAADLPVAGQRRLPTRCPRTHASWSALARKQLAYGQNARTCRAGAGSGQRCFYRPRHNGTLPGAPGGQSPGRRRARAAYHWWQTGPFRHRRN